MTPPDDPPPEDSPDGGEPDDDSDTVADRSSDSTAAPGPDTLVARARDAATNAVAPYSEYRVGAAVATPSGVYTGCNLEVANYSNSLHAEEVALASALSDGVREFDAIAITTTSRNGATPCGSCRQTLWEFCEQSVPVYCDAGETYDTYALEELLPAAFSLE